MKAEPVSTPVAVPVKHKKPSKVTEMRIRSYSEMACFLPIALLGIVFYFLEAWAPIEVLSYLWMVTLLLCIAGAAYQLNIIETGAIVILLVVVVPVADWFQLRWVQPVLVWFTRELGVVQTGPMLTLSKWILILLSIEWVVMRFFFFDISSNRLECVRYLQTEPAEDLKTVTVAPHYGNFFKLLLFGMGDLVFMRQKNEVRRITDIPFLWFKWPKIEQMIETTAVSVYAPDQEQP